MKIPQHVAIISDGNGRWAKSKGLPRNAGHTAGAKNVETICQAAHDMGIKYVTMYAFSTENWSRPQAEVDALMNLLESYLKNLDNLGISQEIPLKITIPCRNCHQIEIYEIYEKHYEFKENLKK